MSPEGDEKSNTARTFCRRCSNHTCAVVGVIGTVLLFLFLATYGIKYLYEIQILYIDVNRPSPYRTSQQFVSVGLDSSVIADGFNKFNTTDKKLIKMLQHLYPAYLRIGGNLADRLHFSSESTEPDKHVENYYRKLNSYREYTDLPVAPNYTMTGSQWLKLMELAGKVKLKVIFDLNVLIRFPNGTWDYRNAESLIKFSNDHRLKVNWELGNEPDSFRHTFNEEVSAEQLADDFITLRNILKKYPMYKNSLLVGPDTTRPRDEHKNSEIYLRKFLEDADHVIDAITWHQYYLNGRTAVPENFLDPAVFDSLKTEIQIVKNITHSLYIWNKPIWLGETSSAYGGGAPNLSDTFIGSFMWLDKLGLSAKMGIRVVIRQSIFKGDYALLDNNYDPNPDWWISVLYKKLVGINVVPCYGALVSQVRLYCHCTKLSIFSGNPPSVTVFGINMQNSTAHIRIEGMFPQDHDIYPLSTVYAFEVTSDDSLLSKNVYLNGRLLKMTKDNNLPELVPKIINSRPFVTMPPFSIVFWVVPSPYITACLYATA